MGTAFTVRLDNDRVKVVVSEGEVDLAVVQAVVEKVIEDIGASKVNPGDVTKRASQDKSQQENNTTNAVFGSLKAGQSIEIPVDIKGVMAQVEYHDPQALNRHLAWIEGKLVFDGEPLERVVREVSRYTNIKIEVTDPELKQLRIGGQFQIGETEALFDVLQSGFGVAINRISETHVQIYAP